MKRLMLTILLCTGCAGQKESVPKTMADWVVAQNAKNQPCKPEDEGSFVSAAGNSYDSYVAHCRGGKIVYEDTSEQTRLAVAKYEAHKSELVLVTRSRTLTPEEMKELLSFGPSIFTRNMQPYRQEDIEKQFDELLYQQARLKALRARPAGAGEQQP